MLRPRICVLAIALALAACGGGAGGGGGENQGVLLVATGLPDYDGTIIFYSENECEVDAVVPFARVGEHDGASKFATFYGFITFDISDLPDGATILSAVAHVRLGEVLGDNVFTPGLFGNVVLEHVDMGVELDEPDILTPSLSGQLVGGNATPTFLATNPILGFKTVDIRAEVVRDLAAGRSRTSLRMTCEATQVSDGDLAPDEARFFQFDPADTTNQRRPRLEIRYREP